MAVLQRPEAVSLGNPASAIRLPQPPCRQQARTAQADLDSPLHGNQAAPYPWKGNLPAISSKVRIALPFVFGPTLVRAFPTRLDRALVPIRTVVAANIVCVQPESPALQEK